MRYREYVEAAADRLSAGYDRQGEVCLRCPTPLPAAGTAAAHQFQLAR
jgi:hypothetical protein